MYLLIFSRQSNGWKKYNAIGLEQLKMYW